MDGFIPKDLAIILHEKGFNGKCSYAFNDEQIINPEVEKKYGPLTDDGYYELTKDGGGDLEWDYVYIYETMLLSRRDIIVKRNFVPAPSLAQVLKWLNQYKRIHIFTDICSEGYFFAIRYDILEEEDKSFSFQTEHTDDCYSSSEEAILNGIEYIIQKKLI